MHASSHVSAGNSAGSVLINIFNDTHRAVLGCLSKLWLLLRLRDDED